MNAIYELFTFLECFRLHRITRPYNTGSPCNTLKYAYIEHQISYTDLFGDRLAM